ncbi:MAG: PilW family protein [Syntrophaceae bacterium]|nr:PilW family protein [Syntrophaceae bacterium]
MRIKFNERGVTLVELLVVMVIAGIVVAGFYRIFIAQSRAYTVQDQVAEVQQDIRNAMEILVRDLSMTGFDYDNTTSAIHIPNIPYQVAGNSITVWYEYYQKDPSNPLGPPLISEAHAITYTLNGTTLERQLTVDGGNATTEALLRNVEALDFTCGRDGIIGDEATQDGVVDHWVNCGTIDMNRDKVIALRISLTARPVQANPEDDRLKMITPRTLTSTVALRNLALKKM